MSLTWAYVFEHPGTDPIADRTVIDRAGQRTLLVPVPGTDKAPSVAAELAATEGVKLVELCGGFGAAAVAAVRAAVPPEVAVGQVAFGADSVVSAAAFAEAAG
ncbi:DUF6506 family protein [Nocardiopsis sp. MG754419]|uniref:DUF6506 family protein n=1 Tax=Nocardiopsis sp. MG754419 TaxID=2259865 RepID=UPI001BA56349|nr:DUF6506 family protein [Nocardiopsis sp. MG754419]MBR8740181.1 hypothetical protein [Nocardiopsis sp. MG754419]